jgi:hypothetical protein
MTPKIGQRICIILLMTLSDFHYASAQLRINEILAANISANFNSYYNYTDWVELYNASNNQINLSNYTLSNNPSDPQKFLIWSEVILQPWEHFIISLDKRNYCYELNVHTNFSLDPDGDYIGIYDPSGSVVDSLHFGKQIRDVSYGRLPDDPDLWGYFKTPTPGSDNNTEWTFSHQTCGNVEFSLSPGYYHGSVVVSLSATGIADRIVYTVNGDYPKDDAQVYTEPITITQSAVIRARCLSDSVYPGEVSSATYFIDIEPADLPMVSLSTDIGNFYDNTYGFYCDGTNGEYTDCAEFPANWARDWERPLNFEYFTPDGQEQINQLIGSQIFGGCSRAMAIKSLSIYARKDYSTNELKYAFFADKNIAKYKSLVLRNSGSDVFASMLRDGFMQTLIKGRMDIDYMDYQPVLVYLNGNYFGFLNLREKMNEHYLENNHGVNPDSVDIIEKFDNVVFGDDYYWQDLLSYVYDHDLSDSLAFAGVKTMLDVDEFMNYFITNIYYENEDWPQANVKYWRERKENAKWRALLFDTDFGFGLFHESGNTLVWALSTPESSTKIMVALLQNESYKNEFIQRFAAHINTTFSPNRVLLILDSLAGKIRPYIPRQVELYQLPYYTEYWEYQVGSVMVDFANSEPDRVRGWIKDYFGISGTYSLSVNIENANEGVVKVNEVDVGAQYTGEHFNDIPVRLTAVPKYGYKFCGWTGDTVSSEMEIFVNYSEDASLTANFCIADPISGIYINEFVADNESGLVDDFGENEDWIELYNSNIYAVNLAGLFLTDSAQYLTKFQMPFNNPDQTTIKPGGYLILWADNDCAQGSCHLPFKLNKGGESLFLSQMYGNQTSIIDSISYPRQFTDASYGRDPIRFSSWEYMNPTPGSENIDVRIENVYINEFMASNSSVLMDEYNEYDDWIEIYNDNNYSVDIGGMFVTDSLGDNIKTRIPLSDPGSTIIPPKGFLLLWADDSVEQGILHCNFKLAGEGEQIGLVQPNGKNFIDSLTYPKLISDAPFGRSVDGIGKFGYMLATPGASNVQPVFDNLYINEFMASNRLTLPDNKNEYDDWIEIYNNNDYPVNLGGLFLSDSAGNTGQCRVSTAHSDSTTVPAKGYLVLWADDSVSQGIRHLNFKLNSGGEQIVLSQTNGRDIIDSVTFGAMLEDAPYGRLTDGGDELGYMIPTPGASNSYTPIHNVFINEIMASNRTSYADNFNEYDDWFEVYNNNDFPVNLAGVFFTDSFTNKIKFRVSSVYPDSTIIPPKGYMIFWADDSTEQGIAHVNFKLDAGGEEIGIAQTNGRDIIDTIQFHKMYSDVSFGRRSDGDANLCYLMPTPLSANTFFEYAGVSINEIMASDQSLFMDNFNEYDDWIELYNSNDHPINIAGMFITDSLEAPDRSQVSFSDLDSTAIPPHGFLVLWADNQPEQGIRHLHFKLTEGGEQVGLFGNTGTDVIDSLSYGNQYNNFSYSKITGKGWFTVPPTPFAENTVPVISSVYVNEIMADNDNWIPDEYGEYGDWIELYNDNDFDINIAGLYLTDSFAYPTKYRIPSNALAETNIPAKGYKIIWLDNEPEQGTLHTNFKLRREGDRIGIFNYIYSDPIDTLSFSEQYKNFSYAKLPGTNNWLAIPPTPCAANEIPDLSNLFINEIMTSNSYTITDNYGEYDDWIEFYNGGDFPVNLGGLFISDSIGTQKPFRISSEFPDSTTIDPGQFILLWADDSTEQGICHLNFKLNREEDQLILFSYDKTGVVDSITIAKIPQDKSYGRMHDGKSKWIELLIPTPGRSNTINFTDTLAGSIRHTDVSVFPNPADDMVIFKVVLIEDSKVTIRIFDIAGDIVSVPLMNHFPEGVYNISWNLESSDGSPLSSGVYSYSVETNSETITGKLVILYR